jgi:polyisoprenoid-binding protein YceI
MATITLPPVGHYTLDPARTTIGLSMKAMWGLVPVRATFALRRGTVTVSSATTAAVDVVAETASFASGIAKRDAHVKSADFLDVSAYPDLTFTGEELVGQGGTLRLRGVLTDRAATPAELEITELVIDDDQQGFAARATTTVHRQAVGITATTGKVGKVITVTITTHGRLTGSAPEARTAT